MAFRLAARPTFRDTITVKLRNERGILEESTFKVDFKRLDHKQLDDMSERLKEMSESLPSDQQWRAKAMVLREVITGWAELLTEGGEPVPYSEENLELLLVIPQALEPMFVSFFLNSHRDGARAKN